MKFTQKRSVFFPVIALFLIVSSLLTGCQTVPPNALQLPTDYLERRQQQTRQYETADEAKILSACSGVLQDLGFTIDEGESQLGVIFASKDRSAKDAGQITAATLLTAASAVAGVYSNYYQMVDRNQKLRAALITRPSGEGNKILVRVSFQRMVWNMRGDLSRIETLKQPEMYTGFFDKLSKAVFLEEQKI